ncbi:alkaline phosphatase [Bacillus pumilus]|uniref:alkaline phosphatase n=1 Tax=Bacillus TaxID=1386 RepID=UPI00017A5DD8|nr:alkaline phosphatase [Bacillus pumilus]EDW21999.1 alkaline phosphatase 3 (Alkaline phosphataseIII) (APase III) [Bacillus pumilus ATCC 7061]MCR4355096.1 alkaline phosphatase [Bacillus pumilus]MCY7501361.1 alkaline phosphatase [Bacillus pumilus]MCY7505690.1 alkaline phosphatase [Bacillus pumilus]MCY7527600.1 alkaline phosphatase [Bacillus pumilus]
MGSMDRKKRIFLMSGILAVLVFAALLTSHYVTPVSTNAADKKQTKTPKNVIFIVGDGMGMPVIKAYRTFKQEKLGSPKAQTVWDPYLVGMQTTHPDDPRDNITDSAAAATAMATGKKTYNDAIAVNQEKEPLRSVVEAAKEAQMKTAFVVSSDITDATPAAFGTHNVSRKNKEQIADHFYDEKIGGEHKVDILLGGGMQYFDRKDRDLVKEFEKSGYSILRSKDDLTSQSSSKMLGLFQEDELDRAIDRPKHVPTLKDMTQSALAQLNQDNSHGFFMLLEGSTIDSAGHENDVVGAMSEMEDFEKAVQAALQFAKKDQETLVVITADHATGGFSFGADGMTSETGYKWDPAPILAAKKTPVYMAKKIAGGQSVRDVLHTHIDFSLTNEEISQVEKAAQSGKASTIQLSIQHIFDQRSFSGWTTFAHTGEDVPVYAYGPGKAAFQGWIDNTKQGKNLFHIIESPSTYRP